MQLKCQAIYFFHSKLNLLVTKNSSFSSAIYGFCSLPYWIAIIYSVYVILINQFSIRNLNGFYVKPLFSSLLNGCLCLLEVILGFPRGCDFFNIEKTMLIINLGNLREWVTWQVSHGWKFGEAIKNCYLDILTITFLCSTNFKYFNFLFFFSNNDSDTLKHRKW